MSELPTVVAATRIEARAVRRLLPDARVVRAGVSLSSLRSPLFGAVVTCGVAGSLRPDLTTGSVVVPELVLRPDGSELRCDPRLVETLVEGARRLGLEPDRSPMVTTRTLVTGPERQKLADRGCASADMETGLLKVERVASVRVVLDTPERELSPVWQRPVHALWHPAAWRELLWLLREGPRCAQLAAAVLASGFAPSSTAC